LYDDRAVSLVTGEKVHKIEARDVLFDLHADGPPIALQPWAENSAQIWLFHDLTDEFPTTGIWNPLTNGTYKIVNSKTGTVLDIEEYPGNPGTHTLKYRLYYSPATADFFPITLVHALASKGGNHHRVGHESWSAGALHSHTRSGSSRLRGAAGPNTVSRALPIIIFSLPPKPVT
jgi:hypothetical protein